MGTILAIEDDKVAVSILRLFLERYGYGFTSAESAASGLALAREVKPSLIIMDLLLPDMNGWEAIETLRADCDTSKIPVIVLSSLVDHASRDRALSVGANAYVCKPYRFFDLKHAIDSLIHLPEIKGNTPISLTPPMTASD